jgi:hypothetical protein
MERVMGRHKREDTLAASERRSTMTGLRTGGAAFVLAILILGSFRPSDAMVPDAGGSTGATVYALTAVAGQTTSSTSPTAIGWNEGPQILLPKRGNGFEGALVTLNLPTVECAGTTDVCAAYISLLVNGKVYRDRYGNTLEAVALGVPNPCCGSFNQTITLVAKIPLSRETTTTLGAVWSYGGGFGSGNFLEVVNYGTLSALLTAN